MNVDVKSPIISALNQRFKERQLAFNYHTTYFDSFGVGAYYTNFHVAHPRVEYDPIKLNEWFNDILTGLDLGTSTLVVKNPEWLYFPQITRTVAIHSEKHIDVRRMLPSSNDTGFEVIPVNKSIQAVIDAGKRGLIHSETRDVTHNLWIVGYPEKVILEMALQGKIGARNFLAPTEKEKFSSKSGLTFK